MLLKSPILTEEGMSSMLCYAAHRKMAAHKKEQYAFKIGDFNNFEEGQGFFYAPFVSLRRHMRKENILKSKT